MNLVNENGAEGVAGSGLFDGCCLKGLRVEGCAGEGVVGGKDYSTFCGCFRG